jgi:arsenate reductase
LLDEHGVEYRYREYRKEPLSVDELRELIGKLGLAAAELLRRRDRAFKVLELSGEEGDEALIGHMAEHPTLLQRPIGVRGERAVVGRPVERLLELV